MPNQLWESHCCDLVMKGGITSGVVFPAAIEKIASEYSLVGIGGTSAGAIAASVAAAAEYQRRHTGSKAGFEYLSTIPSELHGGRLLTLFQPDKETERLFRFLIKGIGLEDKYKLSQWKWKGQLFGKLLRSKPFKPMIDNGYGLCTGMANGNPPKTKHGQGSIKPLTDWLGDAIDRAAGLGEGQLLTFGDLHDAPIPEQLQGVINAGERSIDFRAVTTCMTFGRPFEFPWHSNMFAFDPKEWSRYFPMRVMDHLIAKSEELGPSSRRVDGKLPLPESKDIPVIVAVRMSLSFPGLFAMVPLYARNYEINNSPLERVWFTDGGISSNFPMHRFDALFPRWPTLGINLQYTGKDGVPGRSGVDQETMAYFAKSRGELAGELRHEFTSADAKPFAALMGLGKGLFRSAQVWHDNGYLRLPAFQDRSVEIWMKPKEGGINLNMKGSVIKTLEERGALAGQLICDRFRNPKSIDPMGWPAHRWMRYRSGMEGLFSYLHRFNNTALNPMQGDTAMLELLNQNRSEMSESQFSSASNITGLLLDLMKQASEENTCSNNPESRPFCGGPKPKGTIGTRVPM